MEYKDYYEAIEAFMKEIDGLHVKSIGLVALVDETDIFDVVSCYDTGPHELAAMAGILQMHAAHRYEEVNRETEEDEDEQE